MDNDHTWAHQQPITILPSPDAERPPSLNTQLLAGRKTTPSALPDDLDHSQTHGVQDFMTAPAEVQEDLQLQDAISDSKIPLDNSCQTLKAECGLEDSILLAPGFRRSSMAGTDIFLDMATQLPAYAFEVPAGENQLQFARHTWSDRSLSPERMTDSTQSLGGSMMDSNILADWGVSPVGHSAATTVIYRFAMSQFLQGAEDGNLNARIWCHENMSTPSLMTNLESEDDPTDDKTASPFLLQAEAIWDRIRKSLKKSIHGDAFRKSKQSPLDECLQHETGNPDIDTDDLVMGSSLDTAEACDSLTTGTIGERWVIVPHF